MQSSTSRAWMVLILFILALNALVFAVSLVAQLGGGK